MVDQFQLGDRLPVLVERILNSYQSDKRTHHIDRVHLPSRREIIEIIEFMLELVYPGYYGRQSLTTHNIAYHVGELLPKIGQKLFRQIHHCLCYGDELSGQPGTHARECDDKARRLTLAFLEKVPELRETIAGDVQAAYDGDPAAVNTDEVILAYPGVLAVTVYRLAHELHEMNVPLMPRIMTEWAHLQTGVDIHPGARMGRSFFIDHATGVVIGETTEIGENVKLYQGVTLGALSFPKDERGRIIRGHKRHPTVEDGVTIYANATVLGGKTLLGANSVVGGSVFLTRSVPANCLVTLSPTDLRVHPRTGKPGEEDDFGAFVFEI
jgi:serine O-acetyltransferase